MGYTTDFDGQITINPPLNEAEINFLNDFSGTRRMRRANGPLFVKSDGNFGQSHDEDVIDYNHSDTVAGQPGLWCQWVPTEDGTALEWDGGEKFYKSAEWMKYLVENLFAPSARAYIAEHFKEDERLAQFTCDHTFNGTINAQGEDPGDRWVLVVKDNEVGVAEAKITFGEARPI